MERRLANHEGFTHVSQFKTPPRLMIGIDGLPDSGKTEFAMTAPPDMGILALDRGYEHMISKMGPPEKRQGGIYIRTFQIPQPGQNPGGATSPKEALSIYSQIWNDFYNWYKKSISDPEFRTVIIDGDSESWDLQQLATFGKVTQVPPLQRTDINAARRVMISRGFDSGKNIIFTYRVKPEYEDEVRTDSKNNVVKVPVRTGDYKRSGFGEQDYCVQVQLRAMYDPTRKGVQGDKFGVKILKCKPDPSLIGYELWGQENNFSSLVTTIYPDADLREWGLE